jgi:hypothetical protein
MDTASVGPKAVLYDDVDDVLVVRFSDEPFGWMDGLGSGRQVFYARDGSALAVVVAGARASGMSEGLPHAELVQTELAALRRRPRRRDRKQAA